MECSRRTLGTLLVVTDDPLLTERLADSAATLPELKVSGSAEAFRLASELQPDRILIEAPTPALATSLERYPLTGERRAARQALVSPSLPDLERFQQQVDARINRDLSGRQRYELMVLEWTSEPPCAEKPAPLLPATAAQQLRQQLRETDLLGWIGPSSLGIFFATDADDLHGSELSGRLIEAFSRLFAAATGPARIQLAAGIALYPEDAACAAGLVRAAHTACYQALLTESGFLYYSQERFQQAQTLKARKQALYDAVKKRQFELYFQPVVDLRNGRLLGAEGLIRWRHPELGVVNAEQFLPLARSCDLMQVVDTWALEAGCRQMQRWQQAGLEVPYLSLNLSPSLFESQDLMPQLNHLIGHYGLQPEQLCLEMEESVALDQGTEPLVRLNALSEMGLRLAIDHFGTGYASLHHLRKFPFQLIKVDPSFIRSCLESEESGLVLEAIIDMSHKLQLPLVAEGVESLEQIHFLFVRACYAVQGHYFSPPLPCEPWERQVRQGFSSRGLLPEEFT